MFFYWNLLKVRQACAINFFLPEAFQLENTYVKKYRFYQNCNNWKLGR